MIRPRVVRWFSLFLLFTLSSSPAFAETIELVTYYPSSTTTGDLHARGLTVGDDDYTGVVPGPGQAFISGPVGIGAGFTAADPPDEALEVVGNILATGPAGENALFIANRAGDAVLSGLQLQTAGAAQWTLGSRAGSEHLQIFSDVDNATRLIIEQGTGNVGIGTPTPAGRLHVQGADDAVSNVLFTAGADDAGTPAVPAIRVGIGPGFTAAAPPTTELDVNGQIRIRGGNPNPGTRNANAAATQPLFTNANGLASRGWPAGSVIQVVFLNAGSATTVVPYATAQPLGNAIPITPRSANSTLIVEANFNGYVEDNDDTGANSTAYFRMRETTGGGALVLGASEMTLTASSDNSSPNGIACQAPCLVRAIVANGVLTARSFQLYGRAFTSGGFTVKGSATAIVLTVTEIQN